MVIPVVSQHIYFNPPGRCIYCDSTGDPDLHTEHIVPESLGGTFQFSKASCRACSVKTGAVEGHVVAKLFGDARAVLGMRRGKKRKWPEKFPVHVRPKSVFDSSSSVTLHRSLSGFQKREVGVQDLTGAMMILNIPTAGILRGAPLDDTNFRATSFNVAFPANWKNRIKRLGGHVLLGGTNTLTHDQFGLFLAKIAHSYAVALLGIDGFEPFLARAIRQERPWYLSQYVGGYVGQPPIDKTDHLHALGLLNCKVPGTDETLILARIRLFAVDNLSVYDVVVGKETPATKWPRVKEPSPTEPDSNSPKEIER
jgi:hypothetical protein